MFSNFIKIRLVAFLTVLVLPGGLFAAECLDAEGATADPSEYPDETGYIVSIQADQGQGSINCGDFQGPGGPMVPVAITQEGGNGRVNSPILWSVSDPGGFSADLVFAASNDGKRCTQLYAGNAKIGNAAAGSKGGKQRTLIACTDEQEEELPPPPPTPPIPPDFTNAGCPPLFQALINEEGDEWDVMVLNGSFKGGVPEPGEDFNGEGRSAICIDQTLNGGDPATDISPPNRCVNRCIVPDAANDPDWIPLVDPVTTLPPSARLPGGLCTDTRPGFDGRFPIECRVCELTSEVPSDFFEPDLPFCWEQGQDANNPEFPDTFKNPPPDQGNQGWDVNGKFGSTCYLISGRTRSGYPYSYWAPSGCPN